MENAQAQHRQQSAQIRSLPRRATHHGVSQSPRGVPQLSAEGAAPPPPPPAQLQTQLSGDPTMFEPERMQQMFAQLQAYNSFPQARPVTGAAPFEQMVNGQAAMGRWRGSASHLNPPAFAQEHFAMNPFTGPAPLTEFGGGIMPPAAGAPSAPPQSQNGPRSAAQTTPMATFNAGQAATLPAGDAMSNPPDLEIWRQRLFDVDEVIVLTEQQYNTYWPHIDNVYSHRSTQRYKSRPFLSHYYDCRLKGRPAGTPKSTDPNKKKRKRVARERDLCDVKIKVTEYLAGATREDVIGHLGMQPGRERDVAERINAMLQPPDAWAPLGIGDPRLELNAEGGLIQPFYLIQRVSGGAAGEDAGRDDGAGRHRHTLEESDRVKKNSVMRKMLKTEKETKKAGSTAQPPDPAS